MSLDVHIFYEENAFMNKKKCLAISGRYEKANRRIRLHFETNSIS